VTAAQERAASILAEPSFAGDPARWISTATSRAADAHVNYRADDARLWTHVGLLLCEAAGHDPGLSLSNLRESYGSPGSLP
jgi:hypothetical protein